MNVKHGNFRKNINRLVLLRESLPENLADEKYFNEFISIIEELEICLGEKLGTYLKKIKLKPWGAGRSGNYCDSKFLRLKIESLLLHVESFDDKISERQIGFQKNAQ